MFIINTSFLKGKIQAEIINQSIGNDIEYYQYAFYLYKNGSREKVEWYSNKNIIQFDISGNKEDYYVTGFIRSSLKDSPIIISSYTSNSKKTNYDIYRWNKPIYKISKLSLNSDLTFEDGIYQYSSGNVKIDLLFSGMSSFKAHKGILVCFSGAVTKREKKSAPFFSGLNISEKLDVPIISISDPSLELSNELNLAWYTGNSNIKNLPIVIAEILDKVSNILNTRLIIFGGSGGGYATLAVISQMENEVFGAVWNSQTSISKYNQHAVINYIKESFPEHDIRSDDLYSTLEEIGIMHDLTPLYEKNKKNNYKILFLQNTGDKFHLENHTKPFMKSIGFTENNEKVYTSKNEKICFWINYWGDGHITPGMDKIFKTLNSAIEEKSPLEIALAL